MILVARGLASELRGSIGTRISDEKVFKIYFLVISKIDTQNPKSGAQLKAKEGPPHAPEQAVPGSV